MKIVCDSCSTKYSISDDKVRGKVFKIRCKKCSHIIVVRGTADAPAPAEVAGDAVWHLVVDGDQVGPLTDVEVRARLARGEITPENYVWKEGFADWLRLVDVPEFADLGGAAPLGNELFSDSALAAKSGQVDLAAAADGEGPTIAAPSVAADEQGGFFGAGAAGQEARASTRSSSGRTRAPAAAAASPAAEEDAFSLPAATPSRSNEGADLFGMAPVAAATAESPRESGRKGRNTNGAGGGATRHDGGRVENLTAQRSENSVLFSLSNLQSLAAPPATKSTGTPTTEGSGLIDIRAMAASTLNRPAASPGQIVFGGGGGGGGSSTSAADELPTFGAFSSAAPVLFPIPTSSGPPKWLYALIGVAAVSLVIVVWAAFSVLRKPVMVEQTVQPIVMAPPPAPGTAPGAPRANAPEGELPPREKEEASGGPAGEKSGGEKSAASKAGHHGKPGKGTKGERGEKGEKSGVSSEGKSGGDSAAAAPAEPEKAKPAKGSLDDLLEGALNNRGKSRARSSGGDDDSSSSKRGGGDSAGGGGPLAKSAVVAGMNGVKGKVANCYNQYKVPGMAMVNVVISKSGKVTSASVTGKFAGTPTGTCVEAAVRSASFPPSDGLSTPYPFNLR